MPICEPLLRHLGRFAEPSPPRIDETLAHKRQCSAPDPEEQDIPNDTADKFFCEGCAKPFPTAELREEHRLSHPGLEDAVISGDFRRRLSPQDIEMVEQAIGDVVIRSYGVVVI
ncbi:uncharacterized protein VTP21DRAFT_5549 [Calcarisporiella thermophila]|uniref:uncharacterized protein n=1 Tax=Calcarisporiella thermophila TaxID=911321 RepID=UPI0037431DD2